jgi:ABC-type nickel/cobalt efflux system permease component RcnA
VLLTGLALALAAGAVHALSPGHGKTIVAAYLVGSRGTFRHALLLGGAVTVTHTFSVFLIGLGTLFVSAYVVPEKIIPVLDIVSGLSIVAIGTYLFVQRLKTLRGISSHAHDHIHDDDHSHGHTHGHDHGPHTHTHAPPDTVSVGSLIALGASGGLVPCPTAMVLMLSAIALGRIAAGLLLLIAFSVGLAGVLVAVGAAVIYAKHWLPDPQATTERPFFRMIPVLSAAVITVVGALMTAASLGWVRLGFIG